MGVPPGPTRHHALLEVGEVLDVSATPEHVLAAREFEHACTDLRVGVTYRPCNVGDREPEAHESVRVDHDLVLPFESAERRHLGHPGHGLKGGAYGEILQRPEFREIEATGGIGQDVLVDPSDTAGIGPQCRGDAGRQQLLHPTELLEHTRPRPVDVGALVEERVGETHAEHRVPTHGLHARCALERADQRVRDLVFDQIGTAAHPLRVDDDLRVGQIRQRVERRLADGVGGPQRQREDGREDDPLVADRQFDDAFDHGRDS